MQESGRRLEGGTFLPVKNFPDPTTVAAADEATIKAEILRVTKVDIQFHVDGGKGGVNIAQQAIMRRAFVSWALLNTDYLPGTEIPEAFVWKNMQKSENAALILDSDPKKRFENLTRIDLGTPSFESVTSDEILATQRRCLATIPNDHPDLVALKNQLMAFAENYRLNHQN